MKTHLTAIACAGLLLAACAPDAWRPSPEFNGFLTHLQRACEGEMIGPRSSVDNLIRRSQSTAGNFFMNQTSRLYFGKISEETWATQVSSFLNGWPSDPGVKCVQREMKRYKAAKPPSSAPPGDAPPKRY